MITEATCFAGSRCAPRSDVPTGSPSLPAPTGWHANTSSRTAATSWTMTRDVVSVSEDALLEEIVELMIGRRIKRVPVVRGTKLVGIVTRANLLRLLAELLDVRAESGNDDKAIRERIFAELSEQLWARVEGMRVDVQHGEATLTGVITDEWVRDALRVAVENVPGVKGSRTTCSCSSLSPARSLIPFSSDSFERSGARSKTSGAGRARLRRPSGHCDAEGDPSPKPTR